MNKQNSYVGLIVACMFLLVIAMMFQKDVKLGQLNNQNHLLEKENARLMFNYKTMSAEVTRLENLPCYELGEAYSKNIEPMPYYVPVDISEPFPYYEEPK